MSRQISISSDDSLTTQFNIRSNLMHMTKSQKIGFIFCLLIFVSLFNVIAQDATSTPAPTMDMSSMDMNTPTAEVTPASNGKEITIHFSARVGEKDFACGITYDGLGGDQSSVSVSDFRFYVSNVKLLTSDQKEVPLDLEQDGLWQYKDVALLDFEDGTGPCSDGGTQQLRTVAVGTAPQGEYTGIAFEMGVPFELNHLDISTSPSPLNLDAMWWGWQVGFKFLRIDLMANGNPYFIHLGSTGCTSANDTTPPEKPCTYSNRVAVTLNGFDTSKNFVIADLAALVDGVQLSKSEPRPPGCMSGTDDPDCNQLFPNFGLLLESGSAIDGETQKFFHMG